MIGYIAMGNQLFVSLSSSKCTKKVACWIQSLVPSKLLNSRSRMLTCSSFFRTMQAVCLNGATTTMMESYRTVKSLGNTEWSFPVTTLWSHTRIRTSTARLCVTASKVP
ncbi:unnamed protein product [Brassica oleracea var. botrytis]